MRPRGHQRRPLTPWCAGWRLIFLVSTEGRKNAQRSEILLSGNSEAGWEVGLSQTLSRSQLQELVAGKRVVLNGLSGVGYGMPTQQVTRALNAVQMMATDDDMIELLFFLGNEITRDEGAPTNGGDVAELVVKGALQIDCVVPGSVEPEKTLDDPRFSTALCKNLLKNFHLQALAVR